MTDSKCMLRVRERLKIASRVQEAFLTPPPPAPPSPVRHAQPWTPLCKKCVTQRHARKIFAWDDHLPSFENILVNWQWIWHIASKIGENVLKYNYDKNVQSSKICDNFSRVIHRYFTIFFSYVKKLIPSRSVTFLAFSLIPIPLRHVRHARAGTPPPPLARDGILRRSLRIFFIFSVILGVFPFLTFNHLPPDAPISFAQITMIK